MRELAARARDRLRDNADRFTDTVSARRGRYAVRAGSVGVDRYDDSFSTMSVESVRQSVCTHAAHARASVTVTTVQRYDLRGSSPVVSVYGFMTVSDSAVRFRMETVR